MKIIIIGYGIQGRKRQSYLGTDYISTVDPISPEANYKSIFDVPLDIFDAALVCTPDDNKFEIVSYLLEHGKHVLLEKPFILSSNHSEQLSRLSRNAVCYTAYNHRFEPHFIRMKEVIESGVLGKIYSCRMFYGNGTALDVSRSPWRDQGCGVVHDLGSHLLDTVLFWFGEALSPFRLEHQNCFENKAPDHAIMISKGKPFIELEMTLLSWRNTFSCTVLAENGSAHIDSLCKWGPSTFTLRTRVRPSGRPKEEMQTLIQSDPTWEEEYKFFKNLCHKNTGWNNLQNDQWIQLNLPH
jgi:predicted dehydrogenase